MNTEFNDWTENKNGNFVLRDDYDEVLATVYHSNFDFWQITINGAFGSQFVADERLNTAEQAISRAEAILNGAQCTYSRGSTANSVTDWAKQATVTNGQPTYGRKLGGQSVSVKCAKSGQWYYVTYRATAHDAPIGWFDSAKAAMTAFDAPNPK